VAAEWNLPPRGSPKREPELESCPQLHIDDNLPWGMTPAQASVDSTDDELLMMRVRDGEIEQLGVLYGRHRDRLFNFFVRLTGNPSLSEDLVHDVFLRMLKYRHTFETGKRFRTWMYQVARNAQTDSWRRRHREVSLEGAGVELCETLTSRDSGPDLSLGQRQEINLLQRALAGLSFESREVLVLARFQGLRYEEIARVLDCSVSAVKMRVYRGLKELKEGFMRLSKEKL
jgi:RNA polymerase sigma factor (sigma-70 family)